MMHGLHFFIRVLVFTRIPLTYNCAKNLQHASMHNTVSCRARVETTNLSKNSMETIRLQRIPQQLQKLSLLHHLLRSYRRKKISSSVWKPYRN
ncbi:hypothetical protein KC19_2G114500 [Ceratodon purpureus]|uniref:Secreted protein n=1 Tax=Ceratodon purpureus TaxID=3225 RepID=A0A8T0IUH6_CERPU|nr:hypothetical protein KC19_2G114500 [Ceratodon purpureus]